MNGEDLRHDTVINFQLSEAQLEKVLTAVDPKTEPTFPFDKLLQTLQVISIIVAAGWTFYNYLTFERNERTVSARIQEINRDQQEFTLRQNEALAATQRALADLSVKQQELSLKQQQLLASTTQEKARLDVRALELENALKGHEIVTQSQARLKYQVKLKLQPVADATEPDGYGVWEARLYIYVGNISTTEFYINSASIQQYLGSVQPEEKSAHIFRYNDPDQRAGPIKWEMAGSTGYCSIQRCRELSSDGNGSWVLGGPAFGRLQHDEGNVYTSRYQVRARKHSMVGFVVNLNVEEKQAWLWQVVVDRSTDDETESIVESQQSAAK